MIKLGAAKTYFVAGAILILLIFFNYLGWLGALGASVRHFFIPIFSKTSEISIGVGDSYEFFKNREAFFESYEQCRADQQNNTIDEAQKKILTDENAQLKELLGFKEKNNTAFVVARVVGKNIASAEQTIIIDRGMEEGIKPDQPVIVGKGILIGKVVKVEEGLAIVRLINDNQSKIAATTLNTDHSLGVVEGGYGLSVKMNFIPRNETILVGDQIITSGLEANMPRGLLIGSVTAVENETYQPFQEAVLTPGTELAKIYLVGVILTP
ncbi:MAG: rod shape-determining protein MreC [Patescibacteria group bacterium]|nr:rod shape-determining protein MreC [Patescibacteria group bacterium]